jgi:hypothetical protein
MWLYLTTAVHGPSNGVYNYLKIYIVLLSNCMADDVTTSKGVQMYGQHCLLADVATTYGSLVQPAHLAESCCSLATEAVAAGSDQAVIGRAIPPPVINIRCSFKPSGTASAGWPPGLCSAGIRRLGGHRLHTACGHNPGRYSSGRPCTRGTAAPRPRQ